MTLLSTAQHIARDTRKDPRGHMTLIMVAGTLTVGAIALVAYLLWPTWANDPSRGPARLPVSIGATLFTAFQRFDYDFVLTIVLAIIAIVMVGEVLSGWMRRLFQ